MNKEWPIEWFQFILRQNGIPDWDIVSENPIVTWNLVESYPDMPWDLPFVYKNQIYHGI